MRQAVVKMLNLSGLNLDAVSVENPAYPGTPDINFREGWIELKQLADWPVGENTDVRIDCFTPQQRVWIMKRWLAGGNVWLLIQIRREWLLFDGFKAAQYVAKSGMNQERTRALARLVTRRKEEILPIITEGRSV